MGDTVSDTLAELEMMIRAYIALQEKDRNHELLKLGKLDEDKRGITFSPDYFTRCVRETDRHNIHGYMRYHKALKDALHGIDYHLLDTVPQCEF